MADEIGSAHLEIGSARDRIKCNSIWARLAHYEVRIGSTCTFDKLARVFFYYFLNILLDFNKPNKLKKQKKKKSCWQTQQLFNFFSKKYELLAAPIKQKFGQVALRSAPELLREPSQARLGSWDFGLGSSSSPTLGLAAIPECYLTPLIYLLDKVKHLQSLARVKRISWFE